MIDRRIIASSENSENEIRRIKNYGATILPAEKATETNSNLYGNNRKCVCVFSVGYFSFLALENIV